MKRSLFCLFFLVSTIQLDSCVKEGNVFSSDITPGQNLITDQATAQSVLNGVYYQLANVSTDSYGSLFTAFDRIHETPAASLAEIVLAEESQDLSLETQTSATPIVGQMWDNFYAVVGAANNFIQGVSNLADSKFTVKSKNEMLGEARFLRAYANYELLVYFGEFYDVNSTYGVMLRKEGVTADQVSLKRSSVSDTYAYILADIDFAIANAPLINPDYYVNQWAAKALEVRVLMNRGINDDYAQVINLTQDIINNGPYSLEPNLKDLFYAKGLNSQEVILGIKPEPGQNEKYADYYLNFNMFADLAFTGSMTFDPRGQWELQTNNSIAPFFLISKYGGSCPEVSYVFRLTEMYLLQAEAITRSNGDLSEAKALLKTVMVHAGFNSSWPLSSSILSQVDNAATAAQLQLLIYQEITKNLFCEDGAEWFALLRMGFDQVQSILPGITSRSQFILPIPTDEIQKNKSMVQNPGY